MEPFVEEVGMGINDHDEESKRATGADYIGRGLVREIYQTGENRNVLWEFKEL